jgi:hypothetical protein
MSLRVVYQMTALELCLIILPWIDVFFSVKRMRSVLDNRTSGQYVANSLSFMHSVSVVKMASIRIDRRGRFDSSFVVAGTQSGKPKF